MSISETHPITEQRFHGLRVMHPEVTIDPTANRGRTGEHVPLTAVHVELIKAGLMLLSDLGMEPGDTLDEDVYLDDQGRIHVGIVFAYRDEYTISAHRDGDTGWIRVAGSKRGEELGQHEVDLADDAATAWTVNAMWEWATVG